MSVVSNDEGSKKSWLILAAAISLGGLAAWLSGYYLDYKEGEIRDSLSGLKEVKVAVVVPKFEVLPGDVISGSNMVVREIPEKYVPDGAFSPAQFESLVGRKITSPISPGKPLLENSIAGVGAEKFSDLLREGERAITIPMDEFNSTAGMLVAGDKIDLFLLAKKEVITGEKDENDTSALFLMLENAIVLATGKSTLEDEIDSLQDEEDFDQYNTITLGVPLRDAGRIGLARQDGKFVAMLRNKDDKKKVRSRFLENQDVYANITKRESQVEFIIGGGNQNGIANVKNESIEIKQMANKIMSKKPSKVTTDIAAN